MILFSSDQIVPERRLSKPQPFRELIGELSGEVNEAYVLYVAYGPQNEELDHASLESSEAWVRSFECLLMSRGDPLMERSVETVLK